MDLMQHHYANHATNLSLKNGLMAGIIIKTKWPQVKQLAGFKESQMKSKIIQTLVEYVLAIVIFGGIGVLLAWRG